MQTLLALDECLDNFAPVNRMVVPNQNDCSLHPIQQLVQKCNDLYAGDIPALQTEHKSKASPFWRNAYRADRVDSFVVGDERANHGCLAERCPGVFEWRHERKTAFILKRQSGVKSPILFLSAAIPGSASVQFRHRRVAAPGALAFDCSSPFGASNARPRLGGIEHQTTSISDVQSCPASSNPLRNHVHTRHP